jgi:hypothetical protein
VDNSGDNSRDKWERVRQIVRDECERIESRILEVLGSYGELPSARSKKSQVSFANGEWVGITNILLTAWKEAYPAVNVEVELRKAAAHLVSNPHKAPKSQYARFLNTWMRETQNRSAIRSIPTRSEQPQPRKLCEYCDKVATGNANRIWTCGEHFDKALQHEPVPMFKNPVTAKNVTGER